ncbi:MAG: 2-phospho-L-lactate guanylyltransferase [Myxococcota bacterium]
MSVWGLIPQKSFRHSKTRLEPVLADRARWGFAQALFENAVTQLAGAVDGIVVCTDSVEVEAVAEGHRASTLRDPSEPADLAAVVDAGLAHLATRGVTSALVLMPDLPRLTAPDVEELVEALAEHEAVLVRAHDHRHTNALGMSLPRRFATAFGHPTSFDQHLQAARRVLSRVVVHDNPRIAFDVDRPEDYMRLYGHDGAIRDAEQRPVVRAPALRHAAVSPGATDPS